MSVSRSFRRWRVVASLAMILTLVVPAGGAVAQEEPTVSFVGAGWGHGVGLSQYGAYGASREGQSALEIIQHFYKGSDIGTMGEDGLDPKENIWVNLEKDRSTLLLIAEETGLATPEPVVVTRGSDTWELATNYRLAVSWDSSANTCSLEIHYGFPFRGCCKN